MKRYKYYFSIAILGLSGLSMISCNDFLTLYPTDKVVEENFWEDKNDLEGVRYGVYKQMASTIEKFIAWGDIRSDAYMYNSSNPNSSDYEEIMYANPDSTMGIYDWGSVYTTINYCNRVLSSGETVLKDDPQFTRTEWEQMKAEMVAIRDLNYFYLIRAFKDIPFTFEVISSDEDVRVFTNTSQMDILNTLIADLRGVAGKAKSRFPKESDTKGLITNTAIYAILADMYLWRGALREGRGFPATDVTSDADSVIYFGQRSLDALAMQNQQLTTSQFDRTAVNKNDFGSTLSNALLIENKDMLSDYNSQRSMIDVNSYESIFWTQNSEESIFEIQFSRSDDRNSDFLKDIWGVKTDKKFPIAVSLEAFKNALTKGEEKLWEKDCRKWYSCQEEKYMYTSSSKADQNSSMTYMTKWMNCYFDNSSGELYTDLRDYISSTRFKNWIFYRMTDVMLMMAEAYAITGNYEKCRNIVDAIQKRSMLDQTTASGLSDKSSDKTKDKCIDLVMKERLVELLGEGKRWFDLVRYAERIGGGTNPDPREPEYMDGSVGLTKMVDNYLAKGAYDKLAPNLKSRMKNRYGLYSPIYYRERSANKYLIPQNPSWDREKGIK